MRKYVSIVVPVYNEEGNVENLLKEITEVMSASQYLYEVILVNDGSSDHTWEVLESVRDKYPNILAIDLAGNYGQTMALRVGFEKAVGDVIVAMDGDLQHDPAYIPLFLNYIEDGYDLVGGAKAKRPDGFFKSLFSKTAHNIICKISGVKMQYFGATFKAYRSYLLKNTNMLGDTHRFLGALVARKGIRYIELPIEIHERKSGKSNYKWTKVWSVLLDLIFLKFIVSYMHKPFRMFGVAGLTLLTGGALGAGYFVLGSLFGNMNIKEQYMAEFIFSLTLLLIGFLFLSFGVIAQIGVHHYFSKNNQSPYNIRRSIIPGFNKENIKIEEKSYY